mgnify:FL=1
MKKLLLSLIAVFAAGTMMFGQNEILINDFTGTLDPNTIFGDDYQAVDGPNRSVVTFEDNMLKAEYVWDKPDWYPRAVWYYFDETMDFSNTPVLEVKYMFEDNDNDSINIRFDLWGDGAEPLNDTIREMMETNGNPWEEWAINGEWYTKGSNFTEENRWYCTYWNGGIPPTRVDSTKINGFQAFTNYGDNNQANEPGTLWIDYIMVRDVMTGTEKYLVGSKGAFGLAVYPSPVVDNLRINSENMIKRIDIFDITGKRVYTLSDVNKKKLQVNVSQFANGMYITNVYDVDGRVVSEKIIKK